MRYMVVWIQNHDKFIVLIWKTLDMSFGCKNRINSLQIVQLSLFGKYRANKIHMNFIDPIFFRIRTLVHCVTNNITSFISSSMGYILTT
jgi:hypothetical protein